MNCCGGSFGFGGCGDLDGDEEGRFSHRSQGGRLRNGGVIGDDRRNQQGRDDTVHDHGTVSRIQGQGAHPAGKRNTPRGRTTKETKDGSSQI